jgi:hypothetical protein
MPERDRAEAVSTFWLSARQATGSLLLPPPTALPSEDGSTHLVWGGDRHHLSVDLYPDGSFEWFYRDRLTDAFDGTDEERAAGMPEAFARRLRLVAG